MIQMFQRCYWSPKKFGEDYSVNVTTMAKSVHGIQKHKKPFIVPHLRYKQPKVEMQNVKVRLME